MSAQLKSKLKATRLHLSLTQKAFAAILGVPLPTLVSWENDQHTPRGFALKSLNEKLDSLLK